MLHFIEIGGVAVFAFSGALEAARKRMDLFGMLVVALVTALGGGTLRDLLLATASPRPIFWFADVSYIYAALAGGLVGFGVSVGGHLARRALLLADAVGLSVAASIGAQTALAAGVETPIVLILSVMTGVAGGIGRDILCNEVPIVFRPDTRLYATAALLGGTVFLVLHKLGAVDAIASGGAVSAALLLRLIALRWNLVLPTKH